MTIPSSPRGPGTGRRLRDSLKKIGDVAKHCAEENKALKKEIQHLKEGETNVGVHKNVIKYFKGVGGK